MRKYEYAEGTLKSHCLLVMAVFQAYHKTDDQSDNYANNEEKQETASLPASPSCQVSIVPDIRELLTPRPRHLVPLAVGWWRMFLTAARRESKVEHSFQWSIVRSGWNIGLHTTVFVNCA